MAVRHRKYWRLTRLFGMGLASVFLTLSTSRILPVEAATITYDSLGYPNAATPCAHPSFAATGACTNYDWGLVRDSSANYSAATTYSSRGYGYRNCTDYVAWKLESLGVSSAKFMGLGDAGQWAVNAMSHGLTVSGTPFAGNVAVEESGGFGHVAYVESVNSNGTITVSEYNHDAMGDGDKRIGAASELGFTRFINFGVSSSSPSAPAPPPTVSTTTFAGGIRKNTADINADGNDDLPLLTNDPGPATGAHPGLSTNVGIWMWPEAWHDPYTNWNTMTPLTGDVTGDGRADLVYLIPSRNGTQAWELTSLGTTYQSPRLWWNGVGYGYDGIKPALGDVSGDGVEDLVLATRWHGTTIDIATSNRSGFLTPRTWWTDIYTDWTHVKMLTGNINGDGNVDITFLVPSRNGTDAYVLMSTNQGFIPARRWWNGVGYGWSGIKAVMGDVDGNGYADMLLATSEPGGGTALIPGLSTGQGFWLQPAWWRDVNVNWNVMVPFAGNYTGDRYNNHPLEDFGYMVPSYGGVQVWVLPSTHTTLQAPRHWWGDNWDFGGVKIAAR